jgi:hypothetical protein
VVCIEAESSLSVLANSEFLWRKNVDPGSSPALRLDKIDAYIPMEGFPKC